MPEVQHETRSVAELDAERARAKFKLDNWGPDSAYIRVQERAVLDTLDWLAGVALLAPATEEPTAATEPGAVETELMRARDDEHAVRGRDASWRPGAIARTLAWYLRFPGAEPPA